MTDIESVFDQILYYLDMGELPSTTEFDLEYQDNEDLDHIKSNINKLITSRKEFNFHFDLETYSHDDVMKINLGLNDNIKNEKTYKIKLRIVELYMH